MIFYTNIYIHKICISRNISKNNKNIVSCIKDIFRKWIDGIVRKQNYENKKRHKREKQV